MNYDQARGGVMTDLTETETALEDSSQLLSKEPYVDIVWRRRITALLDRVRERDADNERLRVAIERMVSEAARPADSDGACEAIVDLGEAALRGEGK